MLSFDKVHPLPSQIVEQNFAPLQSTLITDPSIVWVTFVTVVAFTGLTCTVLQCKDYSLFLWVEWHSKCMKNKSVQPNETYLFGLESTQLAIDEKRIMNPITFAMQTAIFNVTMNRLIIVELSREK